MDVNLIIPHLGESISAPALAGVLTNYGIDVKQEVNLPDGEYRDYVERPAEGFSLVFTDEAIFFGRGEQQIGAGPMYFSGIFLYMEGKDGYSQYQGPIPFGLDFTQGHDELVALLGTPSWQRLRDDGTIAADRWDEKAEFRIHVTYSLKNGKPLLISLQRPDSKQLP